MPAPRQRDATRRAMKVRRSRRPASAATACWAGNHRRRLSVRWLQPMFGIVPASRIVTFGTITAAVARRQDRRTRSGPVSTATMTDGPLLNLGSSVVFLPRRSLVDGCSDDVSAGAPFAHGYALARSNHHDRRRVSARGKVWALLPEQSVANDKERDLEPCHCAGAAATSKRGA
jgi:hypothetical protein